MALEFCKKRNSLLTLAVQDYQSLCSFVTGDLRRLMAECGEVNWKCLALTSTSNLQKKLFHRGGLTGFRIDGFGFKNRMDS